MARLYTPVLPTFLEVVFKALHHTDEVLLILRIHAVN